MKRIMSVLAVMTLMVAITASAALPAFADKGGFPNANAQDNPCHGHTNKAFNSIGITPEEQAEHFRFDNPGAYNQSLNDFCQF